MTGNEYLARERRRLLVRQALLGPIWRNSSGEVRIPRESVLAELVVEPPDPEGERWLQARLAELEPSAWMRARLAELDARTHPVSREDDGA